MHLEFCQLPDTTPKVSVGLPVLNAERYLPVSLDALLSQTLTDFELIISDNGSTDGTGAMCRAWAGRDPRVGVGGPGPIGEGAMVETQEVCGPTSP